MKQIELLYFEDLSPLHEAVFAFPALGKISMRQMAIIGFSATFSWILYQVSENPLVVIALIAGGYVGFKKFNVKPPEIQMISVIAFMLSRKIQYKRPVTHAVYRKNPSCKLAMPELFEPRMQVVEKQIRIRDVFADPLKPMRFQIKLEMPDGSPISNTPTRVEFDGNVVSTLSTNNNGEIEALIIPQTLGQKRLAVFVKDVQQPVFEEIIAVRNF
jgi:hypothetical protein